jgi:hypothetical protein
MPALMAANLEASQYLGEVTWTYSGVGTCQTFLLSSNQQNCSYDLITLQGALVRGITLCLSDEGSHETGVNWGDSSS